MREREGKESARNVAVFQDEEEKKGPFKSEIVLNKHDFSSDEEESESSEDEVIDTTSKPQRQVNS